MSEQKDEKGTATADLTADITRMNADEGTPISNGKKMIYKKMIRSAEPRAERVCFLSNGAQSCPNASGKKSFTGELAEKCLAESARRR